MKTIHIDEVIIPENRQRREFSEKVLNELAESFQKPHGQLHAIVLRNDERTLVCGERRLRAMKLVKASVTHNGEPMPQGYIAYTTLGKLSPEELHEAELEENVQREDLTWQERVKAIASLHAFRQTKNPLHTAKETATEVYGENVSGRKRNEVQQAIELAAFLEDPLVANAPDEKTARKALKAELQNRRRIAALTEFQSAERFHVLIGGSCYDNVAHNGQFDVILTDPPYGKDMHKKETFDADQHEYDDSDDAFGKVLERLPALAYTTAKENAHLYCFCDITRFGELFVAFELAGWTVWPRPLIWDKGTVGSYGNIEYGFRACYDAILFARKGDKKVTAGFRDVINIQQQTNLKHPAGKPIELYIELLKRSVYPGDRVADFYCGSGPIFHAATALQCQAYGWEDHPKYYAMANEARLTAEGETLDENATAAAGEKETSISVGSR